MTSTNKKQTPVPFRSLLQSALVIQDRNSSSAFFGIGLYITIFFGLLAASLILQNSIRSAETNQVFVSSQPFFLPLLICTALLALFLAILASVRVSRERDRGTLEVLAYGPVNEASFLCGIFLAYLKIYLQALLIIFIWANMVTWILHLAFSIKILSMLLTSSLMAAVLIAFGLLTAVMGGKTRTALVYFFLIILLLGSIQIGDQILAVFIQSAQTISDSLLFIKDTLAAMSTAIQWISPFSQLTLTMDAIVDGQFGAYLLHFVILCAQTLLLFLAGIKILQHKGYRG
jgi:hypothetical protein